MTGPRARRITAELAAGALLAGLYGVGVRLLFGAHVDGFELFSRSFLIGMPMGIGALTMWLALRRGRGALAGLAALGLAVLVFIAICMLTGLEGTICIVLLLPALIVIPLAGSLLAYAGWYLLKRRARATLPALALLPLLIAPLEMRSPVEPVAFTVSDRIAIAAPPAGVWQALTDVGRIAPGELRPAFVFAMGVPRPVESRLAPGGVGAMRTSVWEKDVVFHERVTDWVPERRLAYRFEIDPRRVPARAFDEHVRLGGRYYALRDGSYTLQPRRDGGTDLTLTTTIVDLSRTGSYGRAWGRFVFGDFHGVLLDFLRNRAERP